MPAYLNGVKIAQPLVDGKPWNALINDKHVWAPARDTVTSIVILAENGGAPPKSLAINGTAKLAARATYADGHVGDLLTGKDVTFKSLDTSVATVSGNTVTWKHGGTALITATIGGFTSAALSIACAYAPESIKVTPSSIETRVGDDPVQISVQILPAAASQEFTATVKDPAIATIQALGGGRCSLTALAAGTTTITIKTGSLTTEIPVGVLPAPVNLWRNTPDGTVVGGVTANTQPDGGIRLTGTSTSQTDRSDFRSAKFALPAGTYTLSCRDIIDTLSLVFLVIYRADGRIEYSSVAMTSRQWTGTFDDGGMLQCCVGSNSGTTIDHVFHPMLESGTVAHNWQPPTN